MVSVVAVFVGVALVVGALVVGAPPAGAAPVLEAVDATELAQALAEATEDQDVCYGWDVVVQDYGGAGDGVDRGSSLGVGRTADGTEGAGECRRWVIFEARLTYTSASSEAEDSASFSVHSNVPGAPTAADLRAAGVTEGSLLGDNDDLAVANATLLLPALMAEKGLAAPISLEANTQALPAGDRATGTPGSDWLRKYGAALAVAALIFAGGLAWAAWIFFRERPFAPAPVPTSRRRKR
ncbi:MAG TPA: hypothetical protein VEG38_00095 [Acidimicrobiia bacterium]|nr:hypothetical protein [Acidimicrobiia bacterium]